MRTQNRTKKSETTIQDCPSRMPAFESLEARLLLSANLAAEPLALLEAGLSQATTVDSPATLAAAGETSQFGAEQHAKAGGTDIQVANYSVPVLADWNSDGRPDLLVGEKFDAVSGKVRVYLNNGTAGAPVYGSFFYVQAAGSDLTVPAGGCLGAYPRVHDWNQDGKKDLLIGLADGTIRLYLNTGTAANPSFGDSSTIQAGDSGAKVNLDVGDRATFDIVDWNNDGAVDLVAGALDGKVRVYLNRRTTGEPDLAAPTLVREGSGDLLVPSGRSSVDVHDLNGDGRKDLVLGNTDAQVIFYRNVGTNAAPVFDAHETLLAISGGSRSRPFVADVNADGIADILVGNVDGLVRYYLGTMDSDNKTIGNTAVFSNLSTVVNRRAVPYVMSEDGSIKSISIYHQGGTGNAVLAVYANANGVPGARLGVTNSTPVNGAEGWQTISLQSPVAVSAGQTIWLAWVFENDPGMRWTPGTPGRAISTATWSGGMPTSFGTSSSYNGNYSIYANYSPKSEDKTVGNTAVFSNLSTVVNRRAVPYVMSEDGSIKSISIYHQGGTGNAVLAVYANANGVPGARLGVTNSTPVNGAEGWQTISLQSPVAVSAGQTIWLAWVFENDPGMRWTPGTPGRAISTATWSGGMPTSFGTSSSYNGNYSIYANYSPKSATPTEVIVDNLDSRASSTGSWYTSSAPNPWSTNSMVSWTPGSTFRYTADLTPGTAYNVYAWWTESSCRYTAVQYQIRSGSTLLGTVSVNQTVNGGRWNLLGVYTFTGAPSVTVLSAPSADYSTSADAIKFVAVS